MYNGPANTGGQPGIIDPWANGGQPAGGIEPGAGAAVVEQAPLEAQQAHRDLLGTLLGEVAGQLGVSPQQVAQQYGASTADPNQFGLDDIVRLTQNLAMQHPEIVAMVVQRFPQAQPILLALAGGALGGGGAAGGQSAGGGLLGGILGNLLGGERGSE